MRHRVYTEILTEFKNEICRNPDADFGPYMRKIEDAFIRAENRCKRSVINTLFLHLYGMDAHSLKRDLCKLETLGAIEPPLSQRGVLLRCLYGALSLYIGDDFSEIISMCEGVDDAYKMDDAGDDILII